MEKYGIQQRLAVHAAQQPACKTNARRHDSQPTVIFNLNKSIWQDV